MTNPFTEPHEWGTIKIGGFTIPVSCVRLDDAPNTWRRRPIGRTRGVCRVSFVITADDARGFWNAIISMYRRWMIHRHLHACAVARSRVLS